MSAKEKVQMEFESAIDSRIAFVEAGAVTFGVRYRRYSYREGVVIYVLGPYQDTPFLGVGKPRVSEGRYTEDAPHTFSDGNYVGVEGTRTQYLRAELFDIFPHLHYCRFPTGEKAKECIKITDGEEEVPLDPVCEGDLITWAISRFSDRLVAMLERAEFSEAAAAVDIDQVKAVLPEVEAIARKLDKNRTPSLI